MMYRLSHLLEDLGWEDFDLDVPLSFHAAQTLLLNLHHSKAKQNQTDYGTLNIRVHPT